MPSPPAPSPVQRVLGAGRQLWYSFPVQLTLLQLRQNYLLLGVWIALALFIGGRLGAKFGLRYLFLEPEYAGAVGFRSFFIVGAGIGGLVMTWNLTTYLLSARYFPFLATLQRPFGKYSINNALLPTAFGLYYVLSLRTFLKSELDYGEGQLLGAGASLLLGVATVIGGYVLYFRLTNKDIASYRRLRDIIAGRTRRRRRLGLLGSTTREVERVISGERAWRVDTYLTVKLRPRRTRSIQHYSPEQLLRIFRQNHLNALLLQGGLVGLLMLSGLGIDYDWVRIPAGASILVILCVLLAFAGAITYWFAAWRTLVFAGLLIALNFVTGRDFFTFRNRAYGLSYAADTLPAYTYDALVAMTSPAAVAADRDSMRRVLERWRANTGEAKPRLALLCVSGGGLKATYWTTHVLQRAHLATGGEHLRHTAMISGASGGMIGAAYVRELYLRARLGLPVPDGYGPERHWPQGDGVVTGGPDTRPAHVATDADLASPARLEAVGRDLLNSIGFAIASSDLFLPASTFEHGGERYRKDRGYAFEQQLHENTDGLLARRLGEYEAPERAADIPMLLLTPSVVNDARRLIISPLGVRHLTLPPAAVGRTREFEIDAVDFGALFAGAGPENLAFSTGLRMNATYPYILPNVYLPSEPPLEVLDAGFRDNFGIAEASRFLQVYRDWILANTSGVVLVQVTTLEKFADDTEASAPQGWIESLFNPLGVAGQLMSLQDFQNDENVGLLTQLFGEGHFDFVRFSYAPEEGRDAASMSFHLTAGEKRDIRQSIDAPLNAAAMARLAELLGAGAPPRSSRAGGALGLDAEAEREHEGERGEDEAVARAQAVALGEEADDGRAEE